MNVLFSTTLSICLVIGFLQFWIGYYTSLILSSQFTNSFLSSLT